MFSAPGNVRLDGYLLYEYMSQERTKTKMNIVKISLLHTVDANQTKKTMRHENKRPMKVQSRHASGSFRPAASGASKPGGSLRRLTLAFFALAALGRAMAYPVGHDHASARALAAWSGVPPEKVGLAFGAGLFFPALAFLLVHKQRDKPLDTVLLFLLAALTNRFDFIFRRRASIWFILTVTAPLMALIIFPLLRNLWERFLFSGLAFFAVITVIVCNDSKYSNKDAPTGQDGEDRP